MWNIVALACHAKRAAGAVGQMCDAMVLPCCFRHALRGWHEFGNNCTRSCFWIKEDICADDWIARYHMLFGNGIVAPKFHTIQGTTTTGRRCTHERATKRRAYRTTKALRMKYHASPSR